VKDSDWWRLALTWGCFAVLMLLPLLGMRWVLGYMPDAWIGIVIFDLSMSLFGACTVEMMRA
jgi:hypothetical protein